MSAREVQVECPLERTCYPQDSLRGMHGKTSAKHLSENFKMILTQVAPPTNRFLESREPAAMRVRCVCDWGIATATCERSDI